MVRGTAIWPWISVPWVDATIDQIRRFPRAGAPVPGVPEDLAVRRAPIKGFPYHVIYLKTADSIHLLAFAHDKRRPAYWLPRTEAGSQGRG